MRHLFDADGRQALHEAMRQDPLLAFDFDGTLAPIVPRPDDARASAAVAHRLERLARRCRVAVITGRAVADVAPRLGFAPRWILGSHGAEDPHGLLPVADDAPLAALRGRLAAQRGALASAGVTVEDKGRSLALHYRLAADRQRALSAIDRVLAGSQGLTRFGGKCVVNLVAAGAPDKADAVRALVTHAGAAAAVYVGDDVNDEAVFARAPPQWLTVRIGRDDPQSRARWFLDSQAEIAILLAAMLEVVEAAR